MTGSGGKDGASDKGARTAGQEGGTGGAAHAQDSCRSCPHMQRTRQAGANAAQPQQEATPQIRRTRLGSHVLGAHAAGTCGQGLHLGAARHAALVAGGAPAEAAASGGDGGCRLEAAQESGPAAGAAQRRHGKAACEALLPGRPPHNPAEQPTQGCPSMLT